MDSSAPREIGILLADAQPLDRRGMAALLAGEPGFRVVAEAGSIAEAIDQSLRLSPGVVVLSLGLRGEHGDSPVRTFRAAVPEARILSISERGSGECLVLNPPGASAGEHCELAVDCIHLAAAQGSQGVLRRSAVPAELFAAIRTVSEGGLWRDAGTRDALANRNGRSAPAAGGLSNRELEVAGLLSRGYSNRDIARQLTIAEPTVKKHVGSVLLKLGCQDRLQAGLFVARHPLMLRRDS